MVDINEKRLEELMKAETLLSRLYSNKDTKRDLEKMAKKVNPSAVTVDEQLEPYIAPYKEEIEDLKKWKAKMEENISGYNKNEQIRGLKKAGYTDDGIKAIEDIMEKESIKSYDVAAAYWDKVRPAEPISPNGISPSMWNFQGDGETDESMDLLNKNPDAWQDREISSWFSEQKSRKEEF